MTVTMESGSTTPYTGASCGWGNLGIQGYLYSVPIAGIDNADGCANLQQDFAETNLGVGYLGPGMSFTFTSEVWVNGAGVYTFATNPGCDTTGTGLNTGNTVWSIDFP